MPFINIKTNVSVSDEQKTSIKSAMGRAITAIPGKSEGWLMVGIEPEYNLWFKGDDAPAELMINGQFAGVVYKNEDEGETSYDLNMTILPEDLQEE